MNLSWTWTRGALPHLGSGKTEASPEGNIECPKCGIKVLADDLLGS